MRRKTIVLLGALGWLSACTTPMFTMPPGPQAYRQGYHDGCGAGYAVAGSPLYQQVETAQPARTEEAYVIGWESGFERCKHNFQRMQTVVNSVLGPP